MRKILLDLHEILGEKLLLKILNLKPNLLQKLLDDANQIPLDIEDKLKFLLAVTRNLKGSYNHYGIRRWLERKRTELNDERPIDILKDDWWPRDPKVLKLLTLSADLKG